MATEKTESKAKESKAKGTDSKATAKENIAKEPVGFLRASERAHMAVSEIPLNFLADLGIMTDQIDSYKKLNRKFVTGMYARAHSMAEAPGKFMQSLKEKLTPSSKAGKGDAAPVIKPKPEAKKTAPKAKSKPAAKAAPKAKSKPAAKAAPKAKSKPAASPKTASKAQDTAKVAAKPKANPKAHPIGAMKTPSPSGGIH